MRAKFIRLAVDDAADARELEESLEQEGALVRWHEETLQVLWPQPDMTRMRRWLEQNSRRAISVLDERTVEVADELFAPTPSPSASAAARP